MSCGIIYLFTTSRVKQMGPNFLLTSDYPLVAGDTMDTSLQFVQMLKNCIGCS